MPTEARMHYNYITGVPKAGERHRRVLAGELRVVHNHVRPRDFRPDYPVGLNGFRAWVQERDGRLEACDCGWAPSLPCHYRISRELLAGGGER